MGNGLEMNKISYYSGFYIRNRLLNSMTYQARFMRHDINFTGSGSYKHKQTIRSKNKTNMPYRQKMSEYSSIGTYTSDLGWNRYRAGKFHIYNMKNHSAKSMSDYCKVGNNAEFT